VRSLFLLFFLGVFTSAFNAQSQQPKLKTLPWDSASVPRERLVDFTHLDLRVSFQPAFGIVDGEVIHTFKPLRKTVDSVILDGPGIRIKELSLDGEAQTFHVHDDQIHIRFKKPLNEGNEHKLRIRYNATPRKGIYFIGWNDGTNRARKQIWTQGQGVDNRHWIPMFDNMNDKVTTDIQVRMDAKYKVLSNGDLVSSTALGAPGSELIWHYRMTNPHAPYLIMLGIGDYAIEQRKSKSGVPLNLWYYPDQANRVKPTYRYSVEMFDFFENEIGVPYPWKTYAQIPVQDFMYGAMENTTATIYGDFFYVDERAYLDKKYVGVNAHELAHQWFGDMVTAISPTHHWLQESFATHYNMIYEGEVFGKDYFDLARRNAQNSALSASSRDGFPVASSQGGSTRWYPKGAVILEMLKYVVGREDFNRAIRWYLNRNAYGNVDSHDLLRAFHEVTGQSLDWFWEQWLYRGGEPSYVVSAVSSDSSTTFNVAQMQIKEPYIGLFKMPIWFEVWFTDGTAAREMVWIEKDRQTVEIAHPKGKKVAYTLFDPDNRVMKQASFTKPSVQLIAQARSAQHLLDRIDAMVGLNASTWDIKRPVFTEIASAGKSVKERTLALEFLKDDAASRKILKQSLADKHYLVRQSAIQLIDSLRADELAAATKLLNDSSYVTVNEALKKLLKSDSKNTENYLLNSASVFGDNARNIRFTWLKAAIKAGKKEFEAELIDLCSPSFEFNTRKTAFSLAKELNVANKELVLHAFEAAKSTMFKLNGSGIGNLIWMYQDHPELRTEIEKWLATLGDADWEKKIAERVRSGK
jgi:aminopeptidase N